jgi:ribonuclease BN (tRNA processing enzyme)
MDIILTGTGSPLPDADRAGPSTLVKAGDTHVLVDAGRAVVMSRRGRADRSPSGSQAPRPTHMVPAPTPDQYPEWVARAAEHYDGDVIIGDDLTTITI